MTTKLRTALQKQATAYHNKEKYMAHLRTLYLKRHIGRLISALSVTEYSTVIKFLEEETGLKFTRSDLQRCVLFSKRFRRVKDVKVELSWTHYLLLIRLKNPAERAFYTDIAAEEHWTAAELRRQIYTRYYTRSQQAITAKKTPPEIAAVLKANYVFEFTELPNPENYTEKELEDALTEKLLRFLGELGSGFAFVARQKHLTTASGKHYYVDLVFYNYRLKCFVLFELKRGELTHRDIGQLDMYVRMYDKKYREDTDNPTIGILLCAHKDPYVEQFSMLSDDNRLYTAVYDFRTKP